MACGTVVLAAIGRAEQVEPMLIAPGIKRLKL